MGGATNWREVQTGEDWMRAQEKRTLHEERRAQVRNASDLMGPAMGPYAVRINDWSQAETEFNGLVWSEPGALNSPNSAEWWIGQVIAQQGGFGIQTAWNYRTPGTPALWVRTFSLTGGTRSFTPWQQGGGGGSLGDGTRWLTGAGAPTSGVGEVGNFYLNSTTGEFYEKVTETSWALRGSLRGPQGVKGDTGDKGDKGDQGIPGPEGDPGAPGSKWYISTAAPAAGLGIEGDFHLNVTDGMVSLKTGPLAWTTQGSIKGPKGDKGDKGDTGDQGPAGTLIPVQAEPDPGWPVGTVWWDTDEPVEQDYSWAPVEEWDALTTYQSTSPVSVVTYQGQTWLATATSTSEPPGTGSSWMLLAAHGAEGATTALYGDEPPTTMPGGGPLPGGVIFIDRDAPNIQTQYVHAMRIQQTLMGGGKRIVGSSGVSWEHPFRTVGVGKYAAINPDGYWNIVVPPLGTVIQKVGTKSGEPTTATVAALSYFPTGRYVPLAAGETLWWVPPYGSVYNAGGEFIITANADQTYPDYHVPDEWVFIVKRGNSYPVYDDVSHIWGDGRRESMWQVVGMDGGMTSFANGWTQYTTDENGYNWAAWQKVDGWVNWRGLIKNGTVGAGVIAINLHASLQQVAWSSAGLAPNGDLWPANANGFGRIDVYGAGIRISGGNNAFCSLANLRYWVG